MARAVAGVSLVVLSAAMALMAGALLIGSVASSGYDPQQNRAPALLIGFTVLASALGASALASAVLGLMARDGRLHPFRTLNLIAGTTSMIGISLLFAIAAGEH